MTPLGGITSGVLPYRHFLLVTLNGETFPMPLPPTVPDTCEDVTGYLEVVATEGRRSGLFSGQDNVEVRTRDVAACRAAGGECMPAAGEPT